MAFSWLPTSLKRHNTEFSNGAGHPLLPTNGAFGEDEDEDLELEMRHFATEDRGRRPRMLTRLGNSTPWCILVALLVVIAVFATIALKPSATPWQEHDAYWNASTEIDALYAHQSHTLEQAISRYSLRNSRAPPPMFDKWYDFAREHSCMVDDYDQISRDFEPFYQLAQEDPTFFKRMVDLGSVEAQKGGRGMDTGEFVGGKFSFTHQEETMYTNDWRVTFKQFGDFIPDVKLILNVRDEPRILFNYRKPYTLPEQALNASDPTPFEHSPHPTDLFFKDEMGCIIPNRPTGFTKEANNASAFMLYTSSTQFTTNLYPLLSVTKISPCFADIVVPTEYYNSRARSSPKYSHPNNVEWPDKIPKLYWRGSSTGGHIYGNNYHAFPRFRLVDIGRRHPDLMDVALTKFWDYLCGEQCDGEAIKKEYSIQDQHFPSENVYKYKYLVDVDGNSFSGRFLGLLRSGSLVFKSTVFTEHLGDWLRPFEHYIPVLPDLSDLVEKLEWAIAHEQEARAIQHAGQEFAERVLTDAQNDCYFALVLLEWARLQNMAK